MKAVVFHGVGDIRLDEVPEPIIQSPTDAIVRITASAICGTDLHFIRGSAPDMQAGTILGHEGVGVIETLCDDVRNLKVGDRVLIPSTNACGNCSYCRAGYFAQCDVANPNGKTAGTANPSKVLTQVEPLTDVISAFEAFDRHETGWIKLKLEPTRSDKGATA
jgi:threonine dehydrogenase-like Zn-dependent dehydrogenase